MDAIFLDCRCYKKNASIDTDPTYLVVNPVASSLGYRHKEEATCTLDGTDV
jgi:hypothetical protein